MHAPHPPLAPMSRTASIAAAISAIAVVGIGLSLSIPLLALEMESRGISSTLIGINTAVAGVATIVIAPFVPRFVRLVGARSMLLLGILVTATCLVGFKIIDSFVLWFPLRFLFGGALCVLFVVSEFWINALAPPERRGLIMGIYATALSIGAAAGPALLSYLGSSGWMPYVVGSLVLLAGGIPIVMARGMAPSISGSSHHGVLTFLRRSPTALLAALVFGAIETSVLSFLPVYGIRLGLPETSASLLLTVAVLGNVVFQIPLGLVSDRIDRRVLLLACALLGAVGCFTLTLLNAHSFAFLVMVFLATGITGSLYTVGLAHLGARFHGADLAAANAAFVMLYSVGLIAGPPLAGAGMDAYDPYGFAYVIGGGLLAYALLVLTRLAMRRDGPEA